MKISEIAVYAHSNPVKNGTYRMSMGKIADVPTTLVKITADNGLVGWGEVSPVAPTYQAHHTAGDHAALLEMAPGLIGADPTQIVVLHRRMNSLLRGHNQAKAAIDIATHDLTGKHYGVRVADLLGGAVTERVPSYYSLTIDDPDVVADHAAERVAEGYQRLQIKIGGRPVEVDIETAHKVREKVGDRARLAVDGNRGLTARDTLRLSRECQNIPFIIEQPCNTLDEIRAIRPMINHAIYLDEATDDLSTVMTAASSGLANGFGMKITRIGGLHQTRIVRDVCEAWSLPHTCDDEWGGDIIAAAGAHIAATVQPRLNEGAWIAQPFLDGHYDPRGGVSVEGGHIRLPEGPGLGVVPDETIFGSPLAVFG
ncbi:MAG: mandelate racemase/muconate lactonizing enzyme family protein [Leucobacter sp.]